jgi:hypothetical protein
VCDFPRKRYFCKTATGLRCFNREEQGVGRVGIAQHLFRPRSQYAAGWSIMVMACVLAKNPNWQNGLGAEGPSIRCIRCRCLQHQVSWFAMTSRKVSYFVVCGVWLKTWQIIRRVAPSAATQTDVCLPAIRITVRSIAATQIQYGSDMAPEPYELQYDRTMG